MINPFKEIKWKPEQEDLRKFAMALVIGFPIIAVVLFLVKWLIGEPDPETGSSMPEPRFFLLLGGIGFVVGVICRFVTPIARLLYPVWYGIAACIGIVVANLMFTLLFYVLFTPLGLFMKYVVRRDPLCLKKQEGASSYWKEGSPERPATHYFRQY